MEYAQAGIPLHCWDTATFGGQHIVWPYWNIAKGDNNYNREGDKIIARGVTLKMKLTLNQVYFSDNAGYPRGCKVRFIIGKCKLTVARDYYGNPVTILDDLFTLNGPGIWNGAGGMRDLTNTQYSRGQEIPFTILSDKVYSLDCATGPVRNIIKTFKFRGEVRYQNDLNPNANFQMFKGQYFLYWTTDLPIDDGQISPVTLCYQWRANFSP